MQEDLRTWDSKIEQALALDSGKAYAERVRLLEAVAMAADMVIEQELGNDDIAVFVSTKAFNALGLALQALDKEEANTDAE